jgi:hypothetical protein
MGTDGGYILQNEKVKIFKEKYKNKNKILEL